MIIPSGFALVSHFFSGTGAPTGAAITYGVDLTGVVGTGQTFAAALQGAANLNLMPRLTQEVTLSRTRVKYGPNTTGPYYEVTGSTVGGVTSGAATPQVTYLVNKITNLGGRKGRGRMFLPGVGEAAVNQDGLLTSAFLGQLNTSLDGWKTAILTYCGGVMLFHDDPGTSPTAVVDFEASGKCATQRRRLRR